MLKPPVKVDLDPVLRELLSQAEEEWRNSLSTKDLAKYAGKYIATRHRQVLAANESLDALFEQLATEGIHDYSIEYIEEPDLVIIYS